MKPHSGITFFTTEAIHQGATRFPHTTKQLKHTKQSKALSTYPFLRGWYSGWFWWTKVLGLVLGVVLIKLFSPLITLHRCDAVHLVM